MELLQCIKFTISWSYALLYIYPVGKNVYRKEVYWTINKYNAPTKNINMKKPFILLLITVGFEVVSSFQNGVGRKGPHWAHPSISGGKLTYRHGDMLLVYKIEGT